ncbi:MAG TPA: DinB family protein [Flavisolibacter sp.]
MANIDLTRVPAWYHKYIEKVSENDLMTAFRKYQPEMIAELKNIPAEKWDFSYAPGKWTIKEVVQHIIDAERIFNYRALAFARKDGTSLPGFDENLYADNSKASKRTRDELLNEFLAVQSSSYLLFASFDEDQLEQEGIANGNTVYVKGIGFIVVGHALHHLAVLKERYLPAMLELKGEVSI